MEQLNRWDYLIRNKDKDKGQKRRSKQGKITRHGTIKGLPSGRKDCFLWNRIIPRDKKAFYTTAVFENMIRKDITPRDLHYISSDELESWHRKDFIGTEKRMLN